MIPPGIHLYCGVQVYRTSLAALVDAAGEAGDDQGGGGGVGGQGAGAGGGQPVQQELALSEQTQLVCDTLQLFHIN